MRSLALILLLSLSAPAMAAEPQPALSQTDTGSLPVAGKALAMSGDGLVVAADEQDAGRLLLLDPISLRIMADVALDAPVQALAARDDLPGAVVLTGRDGAVTLRRFGAGLAALGRVPLGRLDQPAVSLTAGGEVVIAAWGGDSYAMVVGADDQPAPVGASYETSRPLSAAWIAGNVAYFNAATDMRLSAINRETGTSYSEYQVSFKDGRSVLPFSVAPLLADRACRDAYQTEFLLGDAELGLLTLLRADAERGILRQIAEASIDTREPLGSRGAVRIASSCNGAAVWLAGASSHTLSQFSVVREGERLEQVGTAALPGPAAALALDWDGKSGWVLLRDSPQLLRFALSQGEPPPLPGRDDVRELQRLLSEKGYSVGAVDGVIGDRTLRATSLVGRSTGQKLDIRTQQGIAATVDTLKNLPASKY